MQGGLPAKSWPPLDAPATAPSTPSPSGWCAGNAGPSTADVYGQLVQNLGELLPGVAGGVIEHRQGGARKGLHGLGGFGVDELADALQAAPAGLEFLDRKSVV